MTVFHLVIFKVKAGATPAESAGLIRGMLELKEKCIHPQTKTPYIVSLKGGKQQSIEDAFMRGNNLAFIVEFSSIEDRDYYVKEDKAHIAFVKTLLEEKIGEEPTIFDFVPGEF